MSIFGGLFSHDKKADPSFSNPQLPSPPPPAPDGGPGAGSVFSQVPAALQPATQVSKLPAAPPRPPSAFDHDHYRQTMLGLAAGFFGANGLGEGLSNAAKTIGQQNASLAAAGHPQLGGPDGAFDVYTNPDGTHRLAPIQSAISYLQHKRETPKDIDDAHGRVMWAISQLPQEQQAGAFADVKANPNIYQVYPEHLPETWSPLYGQIAGASGMPVAQAITRDQAAKNGANQNLNRDKRTEIMADQASSRVKQGDERLGIARDALHLRKPNGGKTAKPSVSTMSNTDLLALVMGH